MALPEESQSDNDNEDFAAEVASHPNLAPHSIEKLYNHVMKPVSANSTTAATGEAEPMSNVIVGNLLRNPNAPQNIKQDFALKTFHPDNPSSDLHEELADSGILNEQQLKGMSEQVLKAGKEPHAYKHLGPNYYMKYFRGRSQQDPNELDEDGKEQHSREMELGEKGLVNSSRHTPETLDQTIDAFSASKHDPHGLIEKLVNNREDLSKDQLNKIHQWYDSNKNEKSNAYNDDYYHRQRIDSLLEHKNVDPALLAKYAVGKRVSTEALKNPRLPQESINGIIKRIKDPNEWDTRNRVESLLENPSISKDQVRALIQKGSNKAIKHPLADEAAVRDYWQKGSKDLDSSRDILQAKNLPPDVLKELVNHKNQEVAVKALNHPRADMDVVNEGLKRRAKTVQDAARLHPLVAEQQVKEGLKSGATSLANVYTDPKFEAQFDKLPKVDQEAIFNKAHEKYQGTNLAELAKKTKERSENVINSKMNLAMDERVPAAIREAHGKDIANMFEDQVPKNQMLVQRTTDVMSKNHPDDNSRLVTAISHLAINGNKDAQRAILNNPGYLSEVQSNLDLKDAEPDFLESVYRKRQENQANNVQLYDRVGHPELFDKSGHTLRRVFEAPNLPSNVFDEIARNGQQMDQIGAGDYFKRYNDLPEDQQNQKYEHILNSGSQKAAISVVRAKAPPASWDRAFNMLTPDNKQRLIKDEVDHVKSHRPDVFHNAVLGMYNDPADADRPGMSRYESYQAKAVSKLDPESPNDRSVLEQLISIPEAQPGHMPDEGLLDNIPEKMYSKPGDDSLIDHAAASGKGPLAYNMLARKMNTLSREAYVGSYESEDKKAAARQKAEDLVTYLHGRVASMPSFSDADTDNPTAENWYSLMTRQKQGYHDDRFMGALKKAGANLDFLADMPGKDGELVKRQALTDNLLSTKKLQEMSQANSVKDILAIGSPKLRQQSLDSWVVQGNHTPEDLEHLANKVDASVLNPESFEHGRRKSMGEEAVNVFNSRINNLIDLYRTKSPDSLTHVINNALQVSRSDDDLTQEDGRRIVKNILNHVNGAAYGSPEEKASTLLSTYMALKKREMAPANMGKQIERAAVEGKDYDTMIKLSDHKMLSEEGISSLMKAAAQPQTLNSRQIAGVSSMLTSNTPPSAVLDTAKAFENKTAQEVAEGKRPSPADRTKLMRNLFGTFSPSESGPEEVQKNEFLVNYMKKQALDPAVSRYANTHLANMSVQLAEAGDEDQGISLWEQLPNQLTDFDGNYPDIQGAIPSKMLNDPRFIEACGSGWKLSSLAINADRLTGANASTLTNRALAAEPYTVDHQQLFRNFENNEFVAPEDSVKLARSMPDDKFNSLTRELGQSMAGNLIYAAHARIRDVDALVKDPNLAAPNAPFMGAEHRNKILTNLDAYATAIKNADVEEETPNLKDKLGKVSEMIGTIHGHLKTIANHMRLQAPDQVDNIEFARDHAAMLTTLSKIATTNLQLDRDDALKVMDMVKEYHSVQQAAGKEPMPEKTYPATKGLVARAENFEEQDWREMFKADPHAIYALSDRATIPTEALNAAEITKIEKSRNKDENRAKTLFVKTSKDWFSKMSKEDVAHHGKDLLHLYIKLKNADEIFHNDYTYAMEEGMKYMGDSMSHKELTDLLQESGASDLRNSLFKTAVENGVGGVESLKAYAKEFHDQIFSGHSDIHDMEASNLKMKLEPITASPYIDEDLAGQVFDMYDRNKGAMHAAAVDLLANTSTPAKSVKKFTDTLLQNHKDGYKDINKRASANLASQIMQHPNVSEEDLGELFALSNEQFPKYFAPSGKFNPALTNPTYGGKLFRAMPLALPESQKMGPKGEGGTVDEGKCLRDINLQHKDYERMKSTMAMIPAEGMAWAEFKRKFPAEEKSLPPSVKAVFTSAQNKPVMPEQFAQAMRSLDDNSKKYHLTYSEWGSGLQRHNPPGRPNLVVQVNNSEASEKELSQDPKLWSLYQHLLQQTNGISNGSIGMHPTTPHMVSWSRVDTDQQTKGKNAWAIEEYQSDFAQKFRRNLKALASKFPSGTKLSGQHVTAEDMKKYAKTIDNHLSDWTEASMQAVIDNAKAQGVTHLYMHGAEMRGYMSNGGRYSREFWDNPNTKPFTVGFRKIYGENPAKFGFKECDYTDYPKHNKDMLNNLKKNKLSTKCWVLELQPPAPKKKKA